MSQDSVFYMAQATALFLLELKQETFYSSFKLSPSKRTIVLLSSFHIRCIFCTHPHITHFPSPESMHTAKQKHKYLIMLAIRPIPHGISYSGHQYAVSVFGNQSPHTGDKVCPAHLWTPSRLVPVVWLSVQHRCQDITDE